MTSHYLRFLSLPTWIAVLVMPLLIAPATAQTTPLVSSGGDTLKMYWVDSDTRKIQRANFDGSNVEDLITTGLSYPQGIALDVGGGKMYWTDDGTDKIQRADLDGSNVEDLITTGLSQPYGIALDVGRGKKKMYWTDYDTDKIQRADLDGSNVEDLITTGLSQPFGIALDVGGGKMYWVDAGTNKIQRADLDGSNVEDLITTGLSSPWGIALDVGGGKMYWVDAGTNKIQRADLNGSNVEDLITRASGLSGLFGIALDVGGGKMYWVDGGTDKIQRADLNGSNVEDLITTGLDNPVGIALFQPTVILALSPTSISEAGGVSTVSAKLSHRSAAATTITVRPVTGAYTVGSDSTITIAAGDTTNASDTVVITAVNNTTDAPSKRVTVFGVASDDTVSVLGAALTLEDDDAPPTVTLMLSPSSISEVGGVSTVSATLSRPSSEATTITVRPLANAYTVGSDSTITIAAGDTTNAADTVAITAVDNGQYEVTRAVTVSGVARNDQGVGRVTGAALTLEDDDAPKMYWTDWGTDKIQRVNIDGSYVEDLITTGLTNPTGIALDVGGGKMYWTDLGTDKIQRADLNGSNVENLITRASGLLNPVSIALDVGGGKMYWTDDSTGKIQRADLNGSNVEDLITTGLTKPIGLALDVGGGKMYWTDNNALKIQRADLNGSNVEDLITRASGLSGLFGIALDVGGGKMYWADNGTAKIQRADLDGSNVEDLITTGLSSPSGLALDVGGGKMYWTDTGTDKIQRADLDGSNVEDLITTGLRESYGLALDKPTVTLALSPTSISEAGGVSTVSAKLSHLSSDATTITVRPVTGAYTVGSDSTITIAAGDTTNASDTVVITAVNNTTDAPDKRLGVSGTVAGDDVASLASGTLTITDDDASPDVTLMLSPSSISEAGGVSTVSAVLSRPSSEATTITMRPLANAYTVGQDSTITIAAGSTTNASDTVVITAVNNMTDAPNNDVTVSGVARNAQGVGSVTGAALTLEDDDASPDVTLMLSPSSISEAGGVSTVSATLSRPSSEATTITVRPVTGAYTVGQDSTIAIAAGQTANTSDTVVVTAVDNAQYEVDRAVTVSLALNNDQGVGSVTGAALTLEDDDASKMYWTDDGTDKIQRANLNGSQVEDLVTAGLTTPSGIVLDVGGGKMYWTDAGANKIQRADLNGSNVEDLITTGLTTPSGLALDVGRGKMYWTDDGTNKIQRADLNGSNVEDLITTGLTTPSGLALDVRRGKMYWTDWGTSKIQRADLSGSNVEDLITGLSLPSGLALDVRRGKMYWTDDGRNRIQRADLDGSDVEDLITAGLDGPVGLALDVGRGKMYWTDQDANKIQRADLSGSNVEDLITTGLSQPVGIALFQPTVILALSPTSISEAGGVSTVSATLSRPSSEATTVTVRPVTGAYTVSQDSTITIAAGDTTNASDTVVITAVNNTTDAPNKRVAVSATVAGGDVASEASVILTIIDDEAAPDVTLMLSPLSISEAGGVSTVSATLSRPSSEATTITVRPVTGAYTVGQDSTIAIAAGQTANTSDTVVVTAVDNAQYELDRAVTVSGVASNDHGVGSVTGAALTLEDDDASKMYWTDAGTDKIQRASLNGSQVEDLITAELESSWGIALDVGGGKMYWTDRDANKIQRADLNGSNVEDLITTGLSSPRGIALDVGGGKMYWVDAGTDKIQRADLDGSNVEDLIATGLSSPRGIALDVGGGKMYWVDAGTDKIQRADLDGSNVEDLITTGLSSPVGIALDVRRGKMYWTDDGRNRIQRADLNGSNVEDLITTGLRDPVGIALDVGGGKMYWTDRDANKIQRADLNGSNVEDLITTGLDNPVGIALFQPTVILALSPPSISEAGGVSTVSATLSRPSSAATTITVRPVANAYTVGQDSTITIAAGDTTNASDTVAITAVDNGQYEVTRAVTVSGVARNDQDVGNVTGAALTLEDDDAPKMYWTDFGTAKIQRVNIDGSYVEDLITTGLGNSVGLALDVGGGKMYWVDNATDKIQRADLDGSNVEDLITTGLGNPTGFALDVGRGKMYWTDSGTAKIQRADLSGSNVEDLITTGLTSPHGIALDVGGGKMYWTDLGTAKIQRADLSGSNVEDLITTGLDGPVGIALDVGGGKMYWTDVTTNKIQRADLDGSNVEDLITTGLSDPRRLALDVGGGKMYWVDAVAEKIQRADLDGSNVEDLITTGLDFPNSIALDKPTVTLALSPSSISEAGGVATVSAKLSHLSSDATTITVRPVTGAYTVGSDSTITIAAGDTTNASDTVVITAVNNTTDAPDKRLGVSGTVAGDDVASLASGTLTITDDEAAPDVTLMLSPSSISEAGGVSTVSATLSRPSSEATTITVRPVTGAYTVGQDSTIAIAAGQTANTSDTVVVTAVDNTQDEVNRAVTVSGVARNAQGAGSVTGATLTLTDDDDEPTLSIASASVDEGATGETPSLEFIVSLSAASGKVVTVGYADATSGTATSGTDYTAITAGTLTFAAGVTRNTIAVSVTGDNTAEPNETVIVTLSNPSNATLSGGGTTLTGTGTITDDDTTPRLSISSPTVVEGSGSSSLEFIVMLSVASGQQVTVDYEDADTGTATSGDDYTAITAGTLTFAAGVTRDTLAVTVLADALDEENETVVVELSNPVNATINTATGTGTITDDDDEPTLSIASASVAEGTTGATPSLEFIVTLSAASGRQVTVDYEDAGTGTATSGTDYTAITAGTLTLAAGVTSDTLAVTVLGDALDEDDETVIVELSNASNATFSGGGSTLTGTGTITDDDAPPTLSIADASVTEGDAGETPSLEFIVSLSAASGKVVTVGYADATSGTATSGDDYTAITAGTLTFAAGVTSDTLAVSVTGDDTAESDETVIVTLSNPSNATLSGGGTTLTGTGTITNDDDEPTLSIASASVAEGTTGATPSLEFIVTLSAASGRQVTVDYEDAGTGTATSGTDYTAITAGTLTLAAGVTSDTLAVTVLGDALDEDDETVIVELSNASNATFSGGGSTLTGTGTITDDDAPPTLSIADASVTEGDAGETPSLEFIVSLSAASGKVVTVGYADATSGTATSGDDYTAITAGTLTFAAGVTRDTLAVSVTGDDTAESDETVIVTLSNPSNATLSGGGTTLTGTGTITNDDGVPRLSISSPTVVEGSGSSSLEFIVMLSVASSQQVTVGYEDAGTGTATSGDDYTAITAGTLTFAAGVTSDTLAVTVLADALDEDDETVIVELSNASNAAISTVTGTGTITDDDAPPVVSIASASVTEGDTGETPSLEFIVSLSAASGKVVTVGYADATSGTATSGDDYTAITAGTLTFAAGVTSDTLAVSVTGDDTAESDETVIVTLSNPSNATLSGGGTILTGTGTITNDDGVPRLSISSPTVAEGSGSSSLEFIVMLSVASSQQVTVDYEDAGTGTATSGDDYTAITAGTLTLAAGVTRDTLAVTVLADALDEDDETVIVELSNASNAAISTATGTGTITDDDDEPTLSIASASVTEGDAGETPSLEFIVSLSAASGKVVTVDYADATSGTATSGDDYTAITAGTLTFAAGVTSDTLAVSVTGDDTAESDETVIVTLSNPSNATLSGGGTTLTGTGTIIDDETPSANLDVDGDGRVDLFTDIIMLIRYALSFREESLTYRALSVGATRTTHRDITDYIVTLYEQKILDVDGDGEVDLFTDIIMIIRYALSFREESLTYRALSVGATRTTHQDITAYIESLHPPSHFQ